VATLRWCDLPTLIHQSSSLQSDARVAALANDGFLQLSMADLSIEGIDFHCSPGLHNIIADRELVETYLTRSSSFHDTFGRVPSTWDERRSWLEGIFKGCMWKYSAGINRRRSLTHRRWMQRAQKSMSCNLSGWSQFLRGQEDMLSATSRKEYENGDLVQIVS
jgi:hypothetical protein